MNTTPDQPQRPTDFGMIYTLPEDRANELRERLGAALKKATDAARGMGQALANFADSQAALVAGMRINNVTINGNQIQKATVISVTSPMVEGWTEEEVRAHIGTASAQAMFSIAPSGWKKMRRIMDGHHLPKRLRS